MPYIETIVCQAEVGKEARFERLVKSRIEFSNRQDGCIKSWYGISKTDSSLFLIQFIYNDMESFHDIKKSVENVLGSKDGGLESCLAGPPLLGLFEISEDYDIGQN